MTWNLPLKLSQHLLLLLLLSAPLLVVSLASENEDQSSAKIISNYFELEEAAITNNTGNREKLYRVFFSPNLPSPKSVMVNYQVNNSGKLVPYRIPFNNKCKNNETWYWMSSAVYFIIDPLVLDRHALYILSWFPPFTEQLQPSLNLTIPPIEEKAAFNLLQQFTMTVREHYTVHTHTHSITVFATKQFMSTHCNLNTLYFFPPFTAESVCQWSQSEK